MKFKIFFIALIFILIQTNLFSQATIRVACVGNSITEGNAMSTKLYDSYPAALSKYMGDDYDVRNFGYSGRTMLKNGDFPLWNEQLFKDAIDFNPHIVIILLGTNDTKQQNWVYKDEFLHDYYSMIDTFKLGTNNQDIYVCYPLPSFSDAYDIRDSIIVNDVIPMITQIVDSVDVKLIDFNTPFLDKSNLMPDGIHPLIEGSDYMAQIILEELTGRIIEEQKENNVALGKRVTHTGNIYSELTDGDAETSLSFEASTEPIIIQLENKYKIEMVQLDFTDFHLSNLQISIYSSVDSMIWVEVADSLVEVESIYSNLFATFPAVQSKFIKIQIDEADKLLQLNQIKVYESRILHAPVISWEFRSESSSRMRIKVHMTRVTDKEEYVKTYKQTSENSPFTIATNYRAGEPSVTSASILFGSVNRFYSVSLKDDIAISSDTITIIGRTLTSLETIELDLNPKNYSLAQNYPNPFNPSTIITFSLNKSGFTLLKLYNLKGEVVGTLVNKELSAGTHQLRFSASNLSAGVYFYKIISGSFTDTKKMLLLK